MRRAFCAVPPLKTVRLDGARGLFTKSRKIKKGDKNMNRKYHLNFQFFATEDDARRFCEYVNSRSSAYLRRKKPAHYTPWEASETFGGMGLTEIKCDKHFVAWFYM